MSERSGSEIGVRLAEIALEIRAIKLSPADPFTWASGYRMPIYNDNRLFLGDPTHRRLIAEGFQDILKRAQIAPEVIGGTVTAGISPGTTLADLLRLPFVYVRDKAKGHGLKNRVEGILRPGERVVMIEDLVSTGGSSVEAINGIREAGAQCDVCLSIFSYGLEESERQFSAIGCALHSLLTFPTLLEVAVRTGYLSASDLEVLGEWRKDPFAWGAAHGFPRVDRKEQ